MNAQPARTVLLPSTRDKAVQTVLSTFGFLPYVDEGQKLLLQDGERRMEVGIVTSEEATMTGEPVLDKLEFSFIGYSEAEADELVGQYLRHTLRADDGSPLHSRDDEVC